jgi:hypothetical protein
MPANPSAPVSARKYETDLSSPEVAGTPAAVAAWFCCPAFRVARATCRTSVVESPTSPVIARENPEVASTAALSLADAPEFAELEPELEPLFAPPEEFPD